MLVFTSTSRFCIQYFFFAICLRQCGEDADENADRMLRGVARCMRPGAAYVCVSYGTPENRTHYLENAAYGWKVAAPVQLPKPQLVRVESKDDDDSAHYVYVCTKNA